MCVTPADYLLPVGSWIIETFHKIAVIYITDCNNDNDNELPSFIKFPKHLDRKLHSHLEWLNDDYSCHAYYYHIIHIYQIAMYVIARFNSLYGLCH